MFAKSKVGPTNLNKNDWHCSEENMKKNQILRKILYIFSLIGLVVAPVMSAHASAQAKVTMTYLVDNSQNTVDTSNALANAYMALHPNVTISIETRPGGTDGDNLIKTRLATGSMDDIFWYNSGSLLQALDPSNTLVDLSKQPFIANIVDSFLPTVSQSGQIFGVPSGTALGGGILYNKKVFAQLGLSVPKTWADFEANNA